VGSARENNQTLVIVTHDLEIARYADTIVHILDGNIEKIEIINRFGEVSNEEVDSILHDSAALPATI